MNLPEETDAVIEVDTREIPPSYEFDEVIWELDGAEWTWLNEKGILSVDKHVLNKEEEKWWRIWMISQKSTESITLI